MPDQYKKTIVGVDETPAMLSARTGVPVCMLLRANRLLSTAWLLPGREIRLPDGDFCLKDAFPCPKELVNAAASEEKTEVCITGTGDTIASIADALGTTERLVLLARGRSGPLREGERILIRAALCKKRIGSVLPGEMIEEVCRRLDIEDIQAAAQLNGLNDWCVWPGMRLILPSGDGV